MIQLYKILKGHDHCNLSLQQITESRTRGHSMKLQKPTVQRNTRKYFFSARVVDKWNKLPASVINAESVNAFKNNYDRLQATSQHWGIILSNVISVPLLTELNRSVLKLVWFWTLSTCFPISVRNKMAAIDNQCNCLRLVCTCFSSQLLPKTDTFSVHASCDFTLNGMRPLILRSVLKIVWFWTLSTVLSDQCTEQNGRHSASCARHRFAISSHQTHRKLYVH